MSTPLMKDFSHIGTRGNYSLNVRIFIKTIAIYSPVMYGCRMAGVKKGERRPWVAGKPRFTNGELQRVTLLLSDKHLEFLHQQGNVSATVRHLIEREMARIQKRTKK